MGTGGGPEGLVDFTGVIAEEIFATECVEPRTSIEKAILMSVGEAVLLALGFCRCVGFAFLKSHSIRSLSVIFCVFSVQRRRRAAFGSMREMEKGEAVS